MQIVLECSGMASESRTTAQLRKLILRVFPDADVRHKHDPVWGDILEVDGCFALMRGPESDLWGIFLVVHREAVRTKYGTQPHSVEYRQLVEASDAVKAVEWLVSEVAQGRLEYGKAVIYG